MKLLSPAWRSRWWWWVLPVAFCLLNGAFLSYHRSTSSSGFRQIHDELKREERNLKALRESRDSLTELLEIAERNREGVADLYDRRLDTEESRLTSLLAEVKELARQAGLDSPSFSYAAVQIEEFGLVKKSIVFRVEGNYPKLRELVNLLELSDHFLILEEIRLKESRGSRLAIDLQIGTLFAVPGAIDSTLSGAGGQP